MSTEINQNFLVLAYIFKGNYNNQILKVPYDSEVFYEDQAASFVRP